MKKKPELLVLLIALLAMAAKLYCASTTYGTVDEVFFYRFAQNIAHEGVVNNYLHDPLFNHPPLLGNYLGFIYELAGGSNTTRASGQRFAFYQRLPGIIADFIVVLGLLWVRRRTGRPPWWAIAVLAASPISFMVSGYHGNFDPLIPLGLVLTVLACIHGRALLAGVLLAVACQVKIIPLIMSPVLFFFWWHRSKERAVTFVVANVLTLLLCWSAPLLAIPGVFARHVLVYNSIWGWWGITYLLNMTGIPAFAGIVSMKRSPRPKPGSCRRSSCSSSSGRWWSRGGGARAARRTCWPRWPLSGRCSSPSHPGSASSISSGSARS
ncbi:hypothetical protein CfE428DRAFT_5295 [Chthoniobacter flavus Ellin428]|uniref:Glycosyltransferase RgtA/B/C/D-like domain-containing protein n=1 Tax=Chthoniobacter flavus Ellin428 TaxID=497964 RepID=B4D8Q5_9BACT|nr:glycosyltransferase 87 family protein [Chthoniobacter flavus]EDY17113.1 hypothetical protein CfE428DRAFT_5295 [Chthoniobacter flavus Ellin428]